MYAQHESRHLGHNIMGAELLLLGLIRQETGIAAKVLKLMGVQLEEARHEVEKIVGRGNDSVWGEISFGSQGKRILELAQEESRKLGYDCVDTEHLLLTLIKQDEETITTILENLGVDRERLRMRLLEEMAFKKNINCATVIAQVPAIPSPTFAR
jgi:ATP-dependent Clp protease ATP-binding subunit ClpC